MEADTPEQFQRYGQYPSLCSADPLPLEILRGGEGKAAHRLPITLHMRIAKECSWTLPGAFSSLQSHSTWPKETMGCGDENGLDIAS